MALKRSNMAFKRLKTREFGRNPDQLPENRKNRQKWAALVLIMGENYSRRLNAAS